MRTSNSICLLCQENPADKENSHIVPKFMTKSILGKSSDKRGYRVLSDRLHERPEFTQDSDKESHILCISCELYFSVIETYISTRLHNRIWDIRHQENFISNQSLDGTVYKVCAEIDPIVFNLFLFSIVWRCSITSSFTFSDFKIGERESELIRVALHSVKRTKQKELIERLAYPINPMPKFHFILATAEYFPDSSMNLVCWDEADNDWSFVLYLNEYILWVSFDNHPRLNVFEYLNTNHQSNVKLVFLSAGRWNEVREALLHTIFKKHPIP